MINELIKGVDDLKLRLDRQDAFWENEIIDRPVISICAPKIHQSPEPDRPEDIRALWLDVDLAIENQLYELDKYEYLGDALPVVFPNLGPDLYSSYYGGSLVYEETTSYIQPFLKQWEDLETLSPDRKGEKFMKIEELYDALFDLAPGRFFVGWPDLHGGADCLSGMRGPETLCMDLYDAPQEIKKGIKKITPEFIQLFDYYHEKTKSAGQPCCGWPGIVSRKKWHVPSNDFSYMISEEQFGEFFLEGIIQEIRGTEASIFHVDGPGVLKHLDVLLDIPELNAIQWVYGAGNGRASDHLPIYQKIQKAGKGIQILDVEPDEIRILMENLKPEGVWIKALVKNRDEGEYMLREVDKWV
ncbi:hypothetical protein [Oceanispirochaeta sp.]|jgi:hypothetical protein|uniref:hypothetical protein n=1 Tax=Oceanispirochaeta sp. TaxID=2035350 RepID=UPI002611ADEA|nr:hypothetical protein [Oceanispirochaeta sp.]MDA3956832.1 hypothetical protein [Oceanispirochaeta sp.]